MPAASLSGNIWCMSTVAEIESAIERLSPGEVAAVAPWLNEYQQIVQASAEVFAMYDREEATATGSRNQQIVMALSTSEAVQLGGD